MQVLIKCQCLCLINHEKIYEMTEVFYALVFLYGYILIKYLRTKLVMKQQLTNTSLFSEIHFDLHLVCLLRWILP